MSIVWKNILLGFLKVDAQCDRLFFDLRCSYWNEKCSIVKEFLETQGHALSYCSSCVKWTDSYVCYWNPDLLLSVSFPTIQKLVIHSLLHNGYINEFLHILLLCVILKAMNLFFLIISYGKNIAIFLWISLLPTKFGTFRNNFFSYLLVSLNLTLCFSSLFLLQIVSSQRPGVFLSEYRRINSALGYLHVLSFK